MECSTAPLTPHWHLFTLDGVLHSIPHPSPLTGTCSHWMECSTASLTPHPSLAPVHTTPSHTQPPTHINTLHTRHVLTKQTLQDTVWCGVLAHHTTPHSVLLCQQHTEHKHVVLCAKYLSHLRNVSLSHIPLHTLAISCTLRSPQGTIPQTIPFISPKVCII